jgi:predicted alpha/beta-fold hydrolase
LSGGSEKGYVKGLASYLLTQGYIVCIFHNRGVSETEYTSAEFADLTRNEEMIKTVEFVN